MKETMKSAVMINKQEIEVQSVPMPEITCDEVLIRVKAVGICGSDLHYYEMGKIGDVEVEMPFVLGHEAAGVVVQTGEAVENVKEGDRVAIEAGVPCMECEFCRQGRYNLCPDLKFLATPPIDGVFSEYVAYPAKWVYPLPEGMTEIEGALIEPLAVGMHAAEISEAQLGDTAFIFGCGCIGLMTLKALKSRGVSQIYMCDVVTSRMEKAVELGATAVFHGAEDDIVSAVRKATQERGVDCVFEMTGSPKCLDKTADVMKAGGMIVLVGLGSEGRMVFDFEKLIWKEGRIATCFRYRNIYPKAIRAISAGLIQVEDVISDIVSLEEVPEAMKVNISNKGNTIKTVITL